MDVFADAGEIFFPLPFVLNPEQVNYVGRLENFIEVVRHGRAEFFEFARHQCARADKRHPRAQFDQAKNIGARHAAKKNVADDDDVEPGDPVFTRADRVEIEQRLGGMLVRAVARIDDARLQPLREELRCPRRTVPQHDEIGVIGLEDFRGVLQRFAFDQTRRRRGDIDDVGAETDRRDLEGGARARARFDEEIDQRLAAQSRHLLDLAGADFLERVSRIQNERDLFRGKFANPEQVFALPADFGFRRARHDFSSLINQTASGSPSTSSRRRRTCSPGAVGRFLPT